MKEDADYIYLADILILNFWISELRGVNICALNAVLWVILANQWNLSCTFLQKCIKCMYMCIHDHVCTSMQRSSSLNPVLLESVLLVKYTQCYKVE